MDIINFIGLYLYLAGLIIAMGALAVIEIHGFLARRSGYWNEATIRTHRVTKPLIWTGLSIAVIGAVIFYRDAGSVPVVRLQALILIPLILNGMFLTFYVSPHLLKMEKEGRAEELLPGALQAKIAVSFLVSIIGWWSELFLLVWYIIYNGKI